MTVNILDFEKPIAEVAEKIAALQLAASDNPELLPQIDKLKSKQALLTKKIYSKLSTWQKVQVARHPARPHTLDFIERIFDEFEELHGDRQFADDASLVGGIAKLESMPVMIIGHEKGRDTEEKIRRRQLSPSINHLCKSGDCKQSAQVRGYCLKHLGRGDFNLWICGSLFALAALYPIFLAKLTTVSLLIPPKTLCVFGV